MENSRIYANSSSQHYFKRSFRKVLKFWFRVGEFVLTKQISENVKMTCGMSLKSYRLFITNMKPRDHTLRRDEQQKTEKKDRIVWFWPLHPSQLGVIFLFCCQEVKFSEVLCAIKSSICPGSCTTTWMETQKEQLAGEQFWWIILQLFEATKKELII